MCLESVRATYKPNSITGTAWKLIRKNKSGKYCPPHFAQNEITFRIGKWITSSDGNAKDQLGHVARPKYETGFHMYRTRKQAREVRSSWYRYNGEGIIIRKVRFKNPTAVGRQCGADVIVAKKMMILNNR